MYTLFLDTHDSLITVGIVDKNKTIIKTKESNRSHSIFLLPMIEDILKEKNIELTNIDKIVVINGPGSFTGLRIGLSVAKTLSYSLNIPVFPISSLDAYIISSDEKNAKMAVIEDNKGYYIKIVDKKNNIIENEIYKENIDELKEKYTVIKNKLDINKIVNYKNLKSINPHLLKANYIKKIEAEK